MQKDGLYLRVTYLTGYLRFPASPPVKRTRDDGSQESPQAMSGLYFSAANSRIRLAGRFPSDVLEQEVAQARRVV